MDLDIFSEEHHIYRRTVKQFMEKEVTPYVDAWREKELIPRSIWRMMGEQGFLGAYFPEEYGGSGADFLTEIVFIEELAFSRSSGLLVDVGTSNDVVAPYIVDYGSEELKKQYLPPLARGEYISSVAITEPGTGSDVAAIRTTAVKDGRDYIINGQKTFITSGYYADVIIVAAKTDSKAEPAHAGVSLILVPSDTSGFTVGRKLKKIGAPDSATSELFFEDCRVPQSNLIGEEGGGFGLIMKQFQHERLVVCAMALAVCEMMLSDTLDYCKDRHAFGKPISGFQVNKHKIVDMATQVEIIKVFLYSLYTRFSQGREDLTKEISMAKYWVCELANRIAYDGVQLHGGYGCMDEYPICRSYRDVRPFTIAAGTTEIMKEIIARYMGL